MTQEDKELLLKDLCARLPYMVKVSILGGGAMPLKNLINSSIGWYVDVEGAPTDFSIDEIKPYLRPMSSMTDEEKLIREKLRHEVIEHLLIDRLIDFYNSRHLDWRGLIPMNLALKAPVDMYKTE